MTLPESATSVPVPVYRGPLGAVARAFRAWPLVWLLVLSVATLFVVIGHDTLASTSRSVLHGLCAQRPSHSFSVGGDLLPFDARMSGIYTGSIATWFVLALRRRLLAGGTPSVWVIAMLGSAVALLAFDGVNALLVDLGMWYPYEPHNVLRFFTGFGTGVALATLEVWLIGSSLWKLSHDRPPWDGLSELWWVPPTAVAALLLILSDRPWVYPILTVLLLASAWITVSALTLVIVVSVARVERRIDSVHRLQGPVVIGAVAALAVIIGLAQLRFWLEATLGIPQDFLADIGVPIATILSRDALTFG